MSKALQQALKHYSVGNYQAVTTHLQPVLRNINAVDQNVAMLMAQSCYKLNRMADAALWYERAALKGGENAQMLSLLSANIYWQVKNPKKSLGLTRKLLEKNPHNVEAHALYRKSLRFLLQFEEFERDNDAFLKRLMAGEAAALSTEKLLDNLQWCGDERLQAKLTGIDHHVQLSAITRRMRPHAYTDKIRIGYLSNDFSDQHATMHLLQGVLRSHDRTQFEIRLFCHTDEALAGVDKSFRQSNREIVPIGHLNDAEAASLIRSMGTDILIDLKGHTRDARWGILNAGAAPVQVSYLGFPGFTTGIDCDYIIGDHVVIPNESRDLYSAKICRMLHSYQANDNQTRALPVAKSRRELDLPEDRIILASFNSNLKINGPTFRIWVQILQRIENSVLWILCEHPDVRAALLTNIKNAGLAENRIIFASVVNYADHIARLPAADIGLDTFPYNGHTTSSDQLWAGLPVPTIKGSNFASRVTESLLLALDMGDLVAPDSASYVDLVVDLATSAEKLTSVRHRLVTNRGTTPLFDTEQFTRGLESAFMSMVSRAKKGLPPDHIDVA